MTSRIASGLLALAFAQAALATPERSITTRETLLGVGDTRYALLRTQDDNLGSHYSARTNQWLVEYDLETPRDQPAATIHLLDVTSHNDINHFDPNTRPAVEREVHHEDRSQTLADLLARFPARDLPRWPDERMAEVVCHPEGGIRFRNRVLLANARTIEAAFGKETTGTPWRLEAISEDADALFLHLVKDLPESRETRIIHATPEATRLVRDQIALKPLYLVAATFDTLDEAVRAAGELKARAREATFFHFNPVVWEAPLPTARTVFIVAEEYSMELIRSGRLAKAREILGVDLVPTSSQHFLRRTRIP